MDPSRCRLSISKHVSPVCEATDQQSSRSFRSHCPETERHEEGNLDVVVDVEARLGDRKWVREMEGNFGGGRQIY